MKTLYAITLTSGAPRQRTYRRTHNVLVSGESLKVAANKAIDWLKGTQVHLDKTVYRVDRHVLICTTPDDVCRHGMLHVTR